MYATVLTVVVIETNVSFDMCLGRLYLVTLEAWKCGNVEICLYCLYLMTRQEWKCGNQEMCL